MKEPINAIRYNFLYLVRTKNSQETQVYEGNILKLYYKALSYSLPDT